jgi:hypothetical protein
MLSISIVLLQGSTYKRYHSYGLIHKLLNRIVKYNEIQDLNGECMLEIKELKMKVKVITQMVELSKLRK